MKRIVAVNLIMALFIIVVISLSGQTSDSSGRKNPEPAAAGASSYYVAQNGSDKNPGTEAKPWKTIQKAAESATPGSTVQIKAGTYYEKVNIKVSGTSNKTAITFTNYKDDRVILDGSRSADSGQEDMIRISNKDYIRIIGLEITNHTTDKEDALLTGIGIWGKGKGIEIKNCKIHRIWYTGASEASGAQAIAVYGRNGKKPVSGLVIDGNEIWDIKCGSSEAVALNGNVDGFQFTNNKVHDTSNIGLSLIGDKKLGGKAVCPVAADNRARNGFVGYNTMTGNSREGNPSYPKNDFSAVGIYADGAKDVVIAYNTCSGNDIGIEVSNETQGKLCSGITVRDNLIFRNKASGIQAGGYDETRGWAADCTFTNNTLYNNDTKRLKRGEINIAKSHDLTFSSNIVYTGSQNLAVITENFGPKDIYNITFHNNIYYGSGGSRGLRFSGTDTGFVGFRMWQSKTGQDLASKAVNPRFKNAGNNDFQLQQRSPAIDAGDPSYKAAEGETDFGRALRINGKSIDCGAFEYQRL
jgi:hypothetical protein